MNVLLRISGLTIDFDTRFPEYMRSRCEKYLFSSEAAIEGNTADILHLQVSDEDIQKSDVNNVGKMEAELYAMTMHLSEHLPALGRLMTHGVAISCDGKSYIFTAKSGVGKSTHAFLWQKYLGADRVKVINGDKPILWFTGGNEVLACGSPWSGKERLDENICLPLGGICLLERLENNPEGGNRIEKASSEETLDFLTSQIYLPHSPAAQIKTFELLENLFGSVPIYRLVADMSPEAVKVSSECLLRNGH